MILFVWLINYNRHFATLVGFDKGRRDVRWLQHRQMVRLWWLLGHHLWSETTSCRRKKRISPKLSVPAPPLPPHISKGSASLELERPSQLLNLLKVETSLVSRTWHWAWVTTWLSNRCSLRTRKRLRSCSWLYLMD